MQFFAGGVVPSTTPTPPPSYHIQNLHTMMKIKSCPISNFSLLLACPDGMDEIGSSCYLRLNGPFSGTSIEKYCLQAGRSIAIADKVELGPLLDQYGYGAWIVSTKYDLPSVRFMLLFFLFFMV